jgi:hypothetical protein
MKIHKHSLHLLDAKKMVAAVEVIPSQLQFLCFERTSCQIISRNLFVMKIYEDRHTLSYFSCVM